MVSPESPIQRDEIPAWCFLTGQFLFFFHRNKNKDHYSLVHSDFIKSTITEPALNDFDYINPGLLAMLLYGLLVYPVELWDTFLNDDLSMRCLNMSVVESAQDMGGNINAFTELFHLNKSPQKQSDFIRKLRHAIAHSNIEIDAQRQGFRFWNKRRDGEIDFDVSIPLVKLGIFLTGLGKHFINFQKQAP